MQGLIFVFIIGSALNGLNAHPKNLPEFNAAVLNQLNHPSVSAADYSKLNQ